MATMTMRKDTDTQPLSESSVSLKLAMIQKRCEQLSQDENDFGGLSLEEPSAAPSDNTNPYDMG
ncbi:MAG: hypothetical protein AAGA33_07400 [Pseudomonadota bacterium]